MIDKIEIILEHMHNVERNCVKLGKKLIEQGEPKLGIALIVRGRMHDLSKLAPAEFEGLWPNHSAFKHALKHHHRFNSHHPEYYDLGAYPIKGIYAMGQEDLAEMVCDCAARSSEFGSDIRKWFNEEATKKYNFSMNDFVGRRINYFLDLLLEPPFKSVVTLKND